MSKRAIHNLMLAAFLSAELARVQAAHSHEEAPLPNYDARRAQVQARTIRDSTKAAADQDLQHCLPTVRVDRDRLLGTPLSVTAQDGFLTGPEGRGRGVSSTNAQRIASSDLHRPTKAFLQEHRALFGHGAEVLEQTRVTRDWITPHNGLRTVIWQQEAEGISVFEGTLVSHTTQQGELVSLSSRLLPRISQAAQGSQVRRPGGRGAPEIAASLALQLAARNLGEDVDAGQIESLSVPASGLEMHHRFRSPNLKGEAHAKVVWLPMSESELRLCWDVILAGRTHGRMYRVLVDAQTGKVQLRHCLTRHLSEATYRVHTSDSPTPLSPGHPTPLPYQPPSVPRSLVTLSAINTNASPNGWINAGDNETRGNNVDAHTDWDADDLPDLPRPQGSPSRVFDFSMDLQQDPRSYHEATVVQLFYWCNWMHDRLYGLGFTETAGNFQVENFGRGGQGGDALQADAQDGRMTDNASMSTPPDGLPPRLEMHLFSGPNPDRDSALDTEVVLHEYTHGLTDRTVGGGMGLNTLQSWGLAEGWSDFYSLALLSDPSDDIDGNYVEGSYATYQLDGLAENYYYGIRRYPYSTDQAKNPLTFKDIDSTLASPHADVPRSPLFSPFRTDHAYEVHCQGEVWGAMLWDARANLIRKHGAAAGNELMLQLVTDSLRLTPANPNFVQARDAVLLADWVNHGGANLRELWSAFARRGLGVGATAPDSETTTGVTESFEVPGDLLVMPAESLVAQGPTGGPFVPGSQSLLLTNLGSVALSWTAGAEFPWIKVSPASGLLGAAATSTVVTVTLDPIATQFPSGIYTNTVWFTNLNTGIREGRALVLRAGQTDFLTELFSARDNDLDYQTFTFTPDGSVNFYSVCRTAATDLPADPLGGTEVQVVDDGFFKVTLSGDHSVALFGQRTNAFFVSANGYLSLSEGDTEWTESLKHHFALPRISALFDDLYPESSGGSVSWREMEDRVVVTFLKVGEYSTPSDSTFQIEWFYDGRVRLTYLRIDAEDGLVGLSRGGGIPPGFTESSYSDYAICAPVLTVLLPTSATENQGVLAGQGQVRVPVALTSNLNVELTSSAPTKLAVSGTVSLPAGATSAVFNVTLVDDALLAGPQRVAVTASALGFASGVGSMLVLDNESASVQVSLPNSATEGSAELTGWVRLSTAPGVNLLVPLASSDLTEIQVPSFVIVPAGQTSAVFTVTIVDDTEFDGSQVVTVTAQVPGWTAATTSITVHDNEQAGLQILLPPDAMEGQATWVGAGVVRLPGTLPTNLLVNLTSLDSTELNVSGTVTILAGHFSAPFNLAILDDGAADGPQMVALVASVAGFGSATNQVRVYDRQSPVAPAQPTPPDKAVEVSVQASLSWESGHFEAAANGGFEAGDFMGWTPQVSGDADLQVNDGTYQPLSWDDLPRPFAGQYSALASLRGPGRSVLWQDVPLPAHVTSAELTWTDRVRSEQVAYSGTHYFRVELRDTNDAVLQQAFSTRSGDRRLNEWVSRSFTLTNYIGRTIRVAFVAESQIGQLSVNVDQVSLSLGVGGTPAYDVYFGRNPSPGASEFLGSTATLQWTLPSLDSSTTYYWQVVARSAGSAPGPVWQFTTRGVDHLEWSPIASPQQATVPFGTAITAKDELGRTVTNFNGTVALTAAIDSSTRLLHENFEDADLAGWQFVGGPYVYGVTTNSPAQGRYSLSITGGNRTAFDGLWRTFPTMTPNRVSFRVRSSTIEGQGGYFVLGSESVAAVYFGLGNGVMGLNRNGIWHAVPFQSNRWYQVTLAFDWLAKRVDLSVDNALVIPGIPFAQDVPYLSTMYLYNWDPVTSGWDDIEFSAGPTPVPVAFSPSITGIFSNGVWNGNITVFDQASPVKLEADDMRGHTGVSAGFDVVPWNDLSLTMTGSPGSILAGQPATFDLVISNSGPAAASSVRVTNTLPAHANFLSATSSMGSFMVAGQIVVFNVGTLNSGAWAALKVIASPTAPLTITNIARAFQTGAECCPENNSAQATVGVWPTVSVADLNIIEGHSGNKDGNFVVTLSAPTDRPVTVDYVINVGTALGGLDYFGPSGSLLIAPGQVSIAIPVHIIGDTIIEDDETFFVHLSSAANAAIARTDAVGTILDDDGLPGEIHTLQWGAVPSPQHAGRSIAVAITARDAAGNVATNFNGTAAISADGQALDPQTIGSGELVSTFPVNTAQCAQRAQTLYLAEEVGSAGALGSLSLWITELPGQALSEWTLRMQHTSLSQYEAPFWDFNNAWTVVLQTNLSINSTGWVTFLFTTPFEYNGQENLMIDFSFNNGSASANGLCRATQTDTPRTLGFATCDDFFDAPVTWIANWPTPASYYEVPYIQLGRATPSPVTVQPSFTGSFVQGVWTGSVAVLDPATVVTLRAHDNNGHQGSSAPFSVIAPNDLSLTMSVAPASVRVGEDLTFNLIVRNAGPATANGVTLTNWLSDRVRFVSATASQGSYTRTSNSVVFLVGTLAAGQSASLSVVVAPLGSGPLTNSAQVTRTEPEDNLLNNAAEIAVIVQPSCLSLDDVTVVEGNAGAHSILIPLRLSSPSIDPINVTYSIQSGTARSITDFFVPGSSLIIAPGMTATSLVARVNGDALYEGDETFQVCLNSPDPTNLCRACALVTLVNDDVPSALSISDATVQEGNAGSAFAVFNVTLAAPSDLPVSVDFTTSDGTALGGSDFQAQAGTVDIVPGTTSRAIQIPVFGDTLPEASETFLVQLQNPTHATLGRSEGLGTIIDDDGMPGQLAWFAWHPMPSPLYSGQPFAAALTARDASGSPVTTYNGAVTLRAERNWLWSHTTGTSPQWENFPTSTLWPGQRTQVIYLPEEAGGPGRITGVSLEVETVPGQTLNQWTVRMKPTTRTNYSGDLRWETNGWTVVLQTNASITATGWVYFALSTPFDYDGSNSLMIDFSFYNQSASSMAACRCTYHSTARTLHHARFESLGDPLTWASGYPLPNPSLATPNLRLERRGQESIPVLPAGSAFFSNGVWAGELMLAPTATNFLLIAVNATGHTGITPPLTVIPLVDRDGDGLPDDWETRYFGSTNATAGADADSDTQSNGDEFRAGTSPVDVFDILHINGVETLANELRIRFPSAAGRRYRLERAANLGASPWLTVRDNLVGTGGVVEVTDSLQAAPSGGFYRIRLMP